MSLYRLACAAALIVTVAASDSRPPLHAQEQRPTFRGGTTVVEVDVIVRNGKRQFVADLKPGDFEVLDEGVPQEISAVYRVIGPGDQAAGVAGGAVPTPLPPPPPQQVQRVVVFFFDQAHMEPGPVNRAKKAALAFLETDFREGDVGGVLDGFRMINNRLTSSKKELEAAVLSVTPNPQMNALMQALREIPQFVDINEALRVTTRGPGYNPGPRAIDDVVARACRAQPDGCQDAEQEAENKATQIVAEARLLGKQTMDTMTALVNGLGRLPGRKTVIMLTEGFFTEDTWADLKDVVGRAARASVRIYALDTRGLNRGSASSDIFNAVAPSQPEMSQMAAADPYSDGPNSLAVDTGGYVIRNENDFGKAFTEFDRDTSSYYIVGFKTNRPMDGKYHELSVRVKRSGVKVRARKGYVASAEALPPQAAPAQLPAPAGVTPGAVGEVVPPVSPIAPVAPPAGTPTPAPPVAPGTAMPAAAAAPAGAVRATPRSASEIVSLGGGVIAPKPKSESSLPEAGRKQAAEGWEAYQKGDVEKARGLLQAVSGQPGAPPWTFYVLGWTELAAGESGPAASNWEKVRGAVPQFEAVYFDLADAYQRQGELARAIAVLRDAEARWPKDVEVYSALGVIQLARGAVDEAIGTFTKGVSVAPTDANACYNLAKTYEVRYVRSQRMRNVGPGSVTAASPADDRNLAIGYYQKVVSLGGPLAEQAKEGLKRLEQLEQ
jgi:VWFA-related protein